MLRRRAQPTSDDDQQGNTLSRLLASEEYLATRLEQAREEAARILADAAVYDREVQSGTARLIEDRIRALRSQRELAFGAELETIHVDAERDAAIFTDVSHQHVSKLVARVLAKLIAIDDVPGSSQA